MSDVKIKPIGDRILVKYKEEKEEEKGGILIPETAKEKPQEAEVVSIGSKVEDGILKVGDIVLTAKFGGTEIKDGNEIYKIYRTDEILAIIK